MTSVLQDKRQKKAWHSRSPGNAVTCSGGAVEHVGKFHTLLRRSSVRTRKNSKNTDSTDDICYLKNICWPKYPLGQ